MNLLDTRFNQKIIFYAVAGLVASLLISLVLLQIFTLIFFLWLFEKNKLKANDSLLYIILAFGVFRLVTIFFSEYFDLSLVAIQKELLFYLTTIALFYYLKTFSAEKNRKIISIFIHAGVLVALVGLFLFSIGKFDRAQSFGSGYATFSTYLLVVSIFILSIKPKDASWKQLLFWALEVGLIYSGIILSMGRANIAITIILGVFVILIRKIELKKIGIAFIFTALITVITLQFNQGESAQRISNPTTLSDRDILYEAFFDLADAHPLLGFGPRTFEKVFPYRDRLADKEVGSWHNDYIQIYLESGIIALLIFLALIYQIMSKSKWVLFKPKKLGLLDEEVFAVLVAIIAILLSGLTGTFFFSPVLSILFAYLISLFSYFWYIEPYFGISPN